MKVKYIAKQHTWFDSGTEATVVEQYGDHVQFALFKGVRFGEVNTEFCRFDEFDIIEPNEKN